MVKSLDEFSSQENDTTVFQSAVTPTAVQVRIIPQRRIDSLKAEESFWYANAVLKKKKPPVEQKKTSGEGLLEQRWFQRLLWFVVLSGFLGAVLWYLQSSNIFIFRRPAKRINEESSVAEGAENIFTLNYHREIAKAEEAQDFRLAVRLHYLQTLKDLSDRRLIEYLHGNTNHDYVTQLSQSHYYRDFFRLTRNFEYTWYGQFMPSAEVYALMRSDFFTFQKALRG
ncbi:MAG TPA: hypothetical protein VFL47_16960 [Flavisolibacter sp.]|nr:hypothetical protein [Flavisolibacter sp.]